MDVPPDDAHGGEKGRRVRRNWFLDQPHEKQDAIILPHFTEAHPKDADVKKAVERYDKDMHIVLDVSSSVQAISVDQWGVSWPHHSEP